MVNLRQRAAAVTKPQSPNKRTSSRASAAVANYLDEEVKIDSSDAEEEEEEEDIELSEDEILEGYISDSHKEVDDDSFDIEDEEELSGSEDDKEIQRIIEKTEAETRNIPQTARQRAKLTGGLLLDGHPTDSKEEAHGATVVTDEQALRNSEKSRRRKLQRDAKMEETKRATIDRLLQKQKKPAAATENQSEETDGSKDSLSSLNILQPGTVRFIDNSNGPFLHFADPESLQSFASDIVAPARRSCRDSLCQICKTNPGKYVHPASGQSFCSLSCYKLIKWAERSAR